ncbi:MAG: DUF1566 domain-containing protein [Trichlorobacter sp.]|uniref:Lcl domain-containing protein n=1 Tax=Trichlorobacter sp. TaxID=2911007 RepID=UPI00255F80FD|nr:DUF1566 domain-containing protein [Trichlorobacter sp.]MDK9718021.1 DUF1566 domain-containing protein [Trichlorobacter sp.]
MFRYLLLLLLCLLSLVSHAADTRGLRGVAKDQATNQTAEVKLYNKSYAVIIGIDRYKNLSPDRQLKNAVKDARGIEATIRKQYRFDQIFTLHDEQATRDGIMRLLTAELPKVIGKEDALFIFWAGHGNQEKTDDGDLGYLIPFDGNSDGIYGNITMSQLKDDISRAIPAKHIFYAFDACYSGLLTTRGVDVKASRNLAYLKNITKERVRQVLTAGSKGQEALDGGPRGHSVFTGRLIEVLEATGDYITANEIQAILKERVYQDARARGHEQTPGFGALYGGGDFVFIPNFEEKVRDNRAEISKIENELKRLEEQEAEAKKHLSEQQQREAEQKRRAAEARLKAEQLRQQQLADDARQQQELLAERSRFEAEQRRKEAELTKASKEEEQRMAALKAELAKKKQSAPTATAGSLEAAVAEVRRLNAQLQSIEATFSRELTAGKNRIAGRYDAEIASLRQAAKQKQKPLVRDEFETEAEYQSRVAKQQSSYTDRIAELEQKKQQEITALEQRLAQEQASETADLRFSLKQLGEKEYTVPAHLLVLKIGQYDPDKQLFPVSISNKIQQPGQQSSGVKVAVNGIIPLPREAARKFKQEYSSGLVRPQVAVHADSGKVASVSLVNDADNSLLGYSGGKFMTTAEIAAALAEKEQRERLIYTERLERERLIYTDPATGLQWARNANMAGEKMNWQQAVDWVSNLTYAGHKDWRLPTKDELETFVKRGGARPFQWFNNNGFSKIQASYYWSSSTFAYSTFSAWGVDVGYGRVGRNGKGIYSYVWPVRAGQ